MVTTDDKSEVTTFRNLSSWFKIYGRKRTGNFSQSLNSRALCIWNHFYWSLTMMKTMTHYTLDKEIIWENWRTWKKNLIKMKNMQKQYLMPMAQSQFKLSNSQSFCLGIASLFIIFTSCNVQIRTNSFQVVMNFLETLPVNFEPSHKYFYQGDMNQLNKKAPPLVRWIKQYYMQVGA